MLSPNFERIDIWIWICTYPILKVLRHFLLSNYLPTWFWRGFEGFLEPSSLRLVQDCSRSLSSSQIFAFRVQDKSSLARWIAQALRKGYCFCCNSADVDQNMNLLSLALLLLSPPLQCALSTSVFAQCEFSPLSIVDQELIGLTIDWYPDVSLDPHSILTSFVAELCIWLSFALKQFISCSI